MNASHESLAQFGHPASDCLRAERRAAPKPARIPTGAEPGREQSSGLFTPGEGLGLPAQCGLQDRATYSLAEGLQ
jgi:hypothetical protein